MTINADAIRSVIDSVRTEIGRVVTFYYPDLTQCPTCLSGGFIDPATDTSYNFNCPVCKGTGWLETAVSTEVLARIHWVSDEAITASPGGKYFLGECTLGINIDDLSVAQASQVEGGKVVVDGHDMSITKILPMGAPSINRYRVVCVNMGDRPQ